MSEDTKKKSAENDNKAQAAQSGTAQSETAQKDLPPFILTTQYIKDISFESPMVPEIFRTKPQMSYASGIDIQTKGLGDNFVEVELVYSGKSTDPDGKTIYVGEIHYAGIVKFRSDLTKEQIAQLLLVDIPHYLFPMVRTLFIGLARDAGFVPPQINVPNFLNLARSRAQMAQDEAAKNKDDKKADDKQADKS